MFSVQLLSLWDFQGHNNRTGQDSKGEESEANMVISSAREQGYVTSDQLVVIWLQGCVTIDQYIVIGIQGNVTIDQCIVILLQDCVCLFMEAKK